MNYGIDNRKRLLIHPRFQLTFLVYMFLFSLIITSVMLTSAYYYYQSSIAEGLAFGFDKSNIFFDYLREQYMDLNKVVLGAASVSSLVLLFGGLYLSHRIVGPLMRFKSELIKIGQTGELREVEFRKGDYFKDLADTFNREMKSFTEKQKNS